MRALDLPPSASEAVVQLRVMGDYSITSEDGDEDDSADNEACLIFLLEIQDNLRWLTRELQSELLLKSKTAKRPRNMEQACAHHLHA